jgi:hypothetical protein
MRRAGVDREGDTRFVDKNLDLGRGGRGFPTAALGGATA